MVSARSRTIKRKRVGAANYKGYMAPKRARPAYSAQFFGRFASSGSELKSFDGSKTSTTVSSSGSIFDASLNLIQQGAAENNRIGRKCVVRSIHLRGRVLIANGTSAAGTSDKCRIMVYVDKQCNGATATVANLLDSANVDSFRNLDNSGRFVVLYDKFFCLNVPAMAGDNAGGVITAEANTQFSLNKKVSIPLEFDASSGAITDLTTNNIGVLCIAADGQAKVNYHWRLRYSDK